MKKSKPRGFDYYLSDEIIKQYQEKSPELRLQWLYMGNLLRKGHDKRILKVQEKFREGKI